MTARQATLRFDFPHDAWKIGGAPARIPILWRKLRQGMTNLRYTTATSDTRYLPPHRS
jgi:hypothetical protein